MGQSECKRYASRLSHRRANKRNEICSCSSSRTKCISTNASLLVHACRIFPTHWTGLLRDVAEIISKLAPRSLFLSSARFKCAHIASGNCIVWKTQKQRAGPSLIFPIMPHGLVVNDSRCGTGPSTFQIYYNSYWYSRRIGPNLWCELCAEEALCWSVFLLMSICARGILSHCALSLSKWDIWISKGMRSRWAEGCGMMQETLLLIVADKFSHSGQNILKSFYFPKIYKRRAVHTENA